MNTGHETWQLEFEFMRSAASFPTFRVVYPEPVSGSNHIARFLRQSGLHDWFYRLEQALHLQPYNDLPRIKQVENLLNEDHIIGLRALLKAIDSGSGNEGEGQDDDGGEEDGHHPHSTTRG